jgi:hypothetical protein
MSWNDITVDELQNDKPLTEGLLERIHENQEEFLSVPVQSWIPFAFHSQPVHTELYAGTIFIPPMLAVSPFTWQMTLPYKRRMSGSSGQYAIRYRLNGSDWTEIGPLTNTSMEDDTMVFDDATLKLAALQGEVVLDLWGRIAGVFNVEVYNSYYGAVAGKIERV